MLFEDLFFTITLFLVILTAVLEMHAMTRHRGGRSGSKPA
jgi:hypothetical protein